LHAQKLTQLDDLVAVGLGAGRGRDVRLVRRQRVVPLADDRGAVDVVRLAGQRRLLLALEEGRSMGQHEHLGQPEPGVQVREDEHRHVERHDGRGLGHGCERGAGGGNRKELLLLSLVGFSLLLAAPSLLFCAERGRGGGPLDTAPEAAAPRLPTRASGGVAGSARAAGRAHGEEPSWSRLLKSRFLSLFSLSAV
jgi:hypothetical protein